MQWLREGGKAAREGEAHVCMCVCVRETCAAFVQGYSVSFCWPVAYATLF